MKMLRPIIRRRVGRKTDKTPNKEFSVDSKQFNELKADQREFLIEHYRRCEAFWRHWTPTIWSIPSVAAAINIGAYSFVFDSSKNLSCSVKIIALCILVLLNSFLTVGV